MVRWGWACPPLLPQLGGAAWALRFALHRREVAGADLEGARLLAPPGQAQAPCYENTTAA